MNDDAIDDIEELLPWYAAGVLSAEERAKVEAALAARPELRASLATIEEDQGETVALNEALGAPSPDVWARVMQGVAEAPRRRSIGGWLSRWFRLGEARGGWIAFAAVAAAVVILLQAAAIVTLLPSAQKAQGGYGVATGPAAPLGADVLVTFSPQATMADVTAFLKQNQAVVVAGPKPGGVYEIRVGDKALPKAELDALVKTLSGSPVVTLVLPGSAKPAD